MSHLTEYLKKSGETQSAFAGRVGLTQATVSKICAGRVGVSLETALRIEAATGGKVPVAAWSRAASQHNPRRKVS